MLSKNRKKFIRGLAQKKIRQKERMFVAEGDKIVKELLPGPAVSNHPFRIHTVVATGDWLEENRDILSGEYEVIESSELPAVSAGNMPVIFGDLEQAYLWCTHQRGLRVIRDDITVPGSTKFYISLQCGGRPGDTRALKALHIA